MFKPQMYLRLFNKRLRGHITRMNHPGTVVVFLRLLKNLYSHIVALTEHQGSQHNWYKVNANGKKFKILSKGIYIQKWKPYRYLKQFRRYCVGQLFFKVGHSPRLKLRSKKLLYQKKSFLTWNVYRKHERYITLHL